MRVDLFQPSGCSSEKHNREVGDGGDRGEDEGGGGGGDGASWLIVSSRVHECWERSETTDRLTRLPHPHQTAQISKSSRRPRPRVCRVTVMEIINTDGVFTT